MVIKYYNDEEIIEMIQEALINSTEAEQIVSLVEERFKQKDQQREYINARLNEAANIIGHNTISECMAYE